MKDTKKKLPYQQILSDWGFPIIISIAILMAFLAKGVVFNGMFMGVMITIALWVIVMKLPHWLKALMGRHILMSDMILTILTFGGLSAMGPGPTIIAASAVQASLTSLLLRGLPKK